MAAVQIRGAGSVGWVHELHVGQGPRQHPVSWQPFRHSHPKDAVALQNHVTRGIWRAAAAQRDLTESSSLVRPT